MTRPPLRRFLPAAAPAFALALAAAFATPSPAATFKLGAHNFTLPEGFTIELAAPPSLVPRPIEADFDEQGRLYVTDSSGSNDPVRKQLADKPHRVLRLEDANGDGVFEKSVVFADKMMFPEGALWHDGSLYVSAPPSIWKLTDTNSDGVADVRVEWFKGQSMGGCANDLHGPYLGPDGWIYWCKGGFEKQTHTLGNGKTFTSRASHIWRARPDGSGLEPLMTGGMDNPVGLAWSADGELFLSGTFFQHPGGGKRDGLIHVVYGGVYGKDHDVLEGHPRTGELLPIMTHLGPAAPVGLARYESAGFGPDYQGNLFCCQFNLHKISRHILQPAGASFRTVDSDFLVSDNPDFHPTDVFEDADGSLLVIDTGGWYKLCCPTSQLQKPDVLGAIYRIRRPGASQVNDPRGLKVAWENQSPNQLAALLNDPRPAVVKRAIAALGKQENAGLDAVRDTVAHPASEAQGLNAVWASTRFENPKARQVTRDAIRLSMGPNATPRTSMAQAAFNAAALHRFNGVVTYGLNVLSDQIPWATPQIKRTAAMALGRALANRPLAVPMAALIHSGDDRALEHALIYLCIETGDAQAVAAGLQATNPFTRRAALIALDQMPGGNLQPAQVTPLLASTNALLQQTALWIVSRHPDWAPQLASFFQDRFAVRDLPPAALAELESLFARFAGNRAVQETVSAPLSGDGVPESMRLAVLRAMAAARVPAPPELWTLLLSRLVRESQGEVRRQALRTARVLARPSTPPAGFQPALRDAALDASLPRDARLDALTGAIAAGETLEAPLFQLAVSALDPAQPVGVRETAATVLGRVRLDATQLEALAGLVRDLGPMELPKLLPAFARSRNETNGLQLLAALPGAKSFRALRPEQLRAWATNFPPSVRDRAETLIASLDSDAPRQKARLDEISLNLKSGDVRRGQAVFNSPKAACVTCHAIGYLGGNLGPDLTKIGQVRTERDLLEAVVFPSASFVRSYEPMVVVTKAGDEHSGILRRDAPDEIVLATGVNAEVRVARSDIAELRPGTVSVMPSGLDEQLTREELADLLAFLKATKW